MQFTVSAEQVHVLATLGQYVFLPVAWWAAKRFIVSIKQTMKDEIRAMVREEMVSVQQELKNHVSAFNLFVKRDEHLGEEIATMRGQINAIQTMVAFPKSPKHS